MVDIVWSIAGPLITATTPQAGTVTTVRWCAALGDYARSGAVTLPSPQPGAPFVEYADLTEAQVLGWVWAGPLNKDAVEAQLRAMAGAAEQEPPWA